MSPPICEPVDWNISSIICDSNYVPVLPSCFQNFLLNLSPLVFLLVGAIQCGYGLRNKKIKVRRKKIFLFMSSLNHPSLVFPSDWHGYVLLLLFVLWWFFSFSWYKLRNFLYLSNYLLGPFALSFYFYSSSSSSKTSPTLAPSLPCFTSGSSSQQAGSHQSWFLSMKQKQTLPYHCSLSALLA